MWQVKKSQSLFILIGTRYKKGRPWAALLFYDLIIGQSI